MAAATLAVLFASSGTANAYVYWTTNAAAPDGPLQRTGNDGSGTTTLISNPDSPAGVAGNTSHLYWVAPEGQIWRSTLNGADPALIASSPNATAVALDATHLFWLTYAGPTDGAIWRANLDGSSARKIVSTGNEGGYGIAVGAGHIYWGAWDTGGLYRSNIDGTGVTNINSDALTVFGIATHGSSLYWSQSNDAQIWTSDLSSSPLSRVLIKDGNSAASVRGLGVDGTYLYWIARDGAEAVLKAPLSDPSSETTLATTGGQNVWGLLANPYDQPGPAVSSISPTTGSSAGGTRVTITGSGYIAGNGLGVRIGGRPATNVVRVSDTTLTATTPIGTAGNRDVVVTNPDTQSAILTQAFTYQTATQMPRGACVGSVPAGMPLPLSGSVRVMGPHCRTNAGQVIGAKATGSVRGDARFFKLVCVSPTGKLSNPLPAGYGNGSRYCRSGVMRLRTFGSHVRVSLNWFAPATPQFYSYSASKTYLN